jgi:hypothetical protein
LRNAAAAHVAQKSAAIVTSVPNPETGEHHMPSSLYLVICGTRDPYVAERDLKDMDREGTINDLARGEWGNVLTGERYRVSSIIEVGTDRDVTAEFEAAAKMQIDAYSAAAE